MVIGNVILRNLHIFVADALMGQVIGNVAFLKAVITDVFFVPKHTANRGIAPRLFHEPFQDFL